MQTQAGLVTIPHIAWSALAKENWGGFCMTPVQKHRLGGRAEKDTTRQTKMFQPYKEKYERCQKQFEVNKDYSDILIMDKLQVI